MNGASIYAGRPNLAGFVLVPSATQTATGTGSAFGLVANGQTLGDWSQIVWQLDVTATLTAAGDTCDVYIQTTIDGTNWVDIVHFASILGNGNAKRYFDKTVAELAQAEFENGTSLSASTVRHLFGDQYRARWVIVNNTSPSFTFSVTANCR